MSSQRSRMAEFRRLKKQEGFLESTIWLSPEDRKVLDEEAKRTGMSRSDVIRVAVRRAFMEETTMSNSGPKLKGPRSG